MWMQINDFLISVFLQLLVNRSKRKRRRRADKAITGTEKVKIINMMTGKKVCYNSVQLLLFLLFTNRSHLCSVGGSFLSDATRTEGVPGGESRRCCFTRVVRNS